MKLMKLELTARSFGKSFWKYLTGKLNKGSRGQTKECTMLIQIPNQGQYLKPQMTDWRERWGEGERGCAHKTSLAELYDSLALSKEWGGVGELLSFL